MASSSYPWQDLYQQVTTCVVEPALLKLDPLNLK